MAKGAESKTNAAVDKVIAAGKPTAKQFDTAIGKLLTSLASLKKAMEQFEKNANKKTASDVVTAVDTCDSDHLAVGTKYKDLDNVLDDLAVLLKK